MDPRQPREFETLTLPNIAARCFIVRVADDQIRPDNIPAAGTAYNAATNKLPNRILQDIWGSYVYGWPIDAPTDYSAFAFVPALPTTPTVKQRIDNIWGVVLDHTYYCLRIPDLPNVADTAVSVLGASYSTRYVIGVSEPREMSGEVIEVTVTTAAAASVTQTDKPIDPETNIATTRTRTWTVAAASPEPSSINASGEYTKVEQISHRTFLSTTQSATTLPTSQGAALTWNSMESLDRAWPAVLENYKFYTVVTSSAATKVTDLFTYRLRQPFAGEVKVENKLWWQSTPLNIDPQNPMIASGIRVNGNLLSFSIPDCLHDTFIYREQNYFLTETGGTLGMLIFGFGATADTDWPDTITKVKQTFKNGGYEIFQQVFYRPAEDGLEQALTVSQGPNTSSLPYYD
jgi:hypothetical protein